MNKSIHNRLQFLTYYFRTGWKDGWFWGSSRTRCWNLSLFAWIVVVAICNGRAFIIVWFAEAVPFWPARPIHVNKRITDRHIGAVMGRKNRKLERTGTLECQISWWGHNLKNYRCCIVFPFFGFSHKMKLSWKCLSAVTVQTCAKKVCSQKLKIKEKRRRFFRSFTNKKIRKVLMKIEEMATFF